MQLELPDFGLGLNTKQFITLYVAFRIASDFVQSLPPATEQSHVAYQTFYKFISLLIGDAKSFSSRIKSPTGAEPIAATVGPSTGTKS